MSYSQSQGSLSPLHHRAKAAVSCGERVINVKLEFDRLLNYFHTPFAQSPDGKTFAIVCAKDYTVELYDTQTGHLKRSLTGDPTYRKGKIISNGVPKWLERK